VRPSQAPTLPRLALLAAVVVQLADGLTFAAGLRFGVRLEAEANPLARLVFVDFGMLGVIGFKLAAVALVLVLVGVAQHFTRARLAVAAGCSSGAQSLGSRGSLEQPRTCRPCYPFSASARSQAKRSLKFLGDDATE
jgi:hypothetical protein